MPQILYLPFDGDADDGSGHGHDGTPTNLTFDTGQFGQGGVFGGNTLVRVSDAPLFDVGAAMTVALWIKVSAVSATNVLIGQFDYGAQQRSWHARVEGASSFRGTAGFFGSMDGTFIFPNRLWYHTDDRIDDGEWHYVLWTFNAGALACWVDGISKNLTEEYDDAAMNTLHNGNSDLTIGCYLNNDTPVSYLTGDLDEVRVFNEVLSEPEIISLYRHNYRGLLGLKTASGGLLLSA